jgi:TetR/AcrR family transcriptional repressor of bet genes
VKKVVAIAKMSPGIVRFYFDSKAAMLVASLQFLATEFEDRVLVPVTQLKDTPVTALERMVALYLDAEIASARKVSVWYSFWGEASSRQEYYDICGQKDESFAALVRELIGRLIEGGRLPHLDADAIALGLIGALEIMWQDFAFRAEDDIDRDAAKQRCMAYLRSIFPEQFSAAGAASPSGGLAGSAYSDARIHALERELLFRHSWSVVGHESQLTVPGDFLTIDTPAERVLVVRGATRLHALRNNCPGWPHRLVTARAGRFGGTIGCTVHGLEFALDGSGTTGAGDARLHALELASVGGFLQVRSATPACPGAPGGDLGAWFDVDLPAAPTIPVAPLETTIGADWKVVVEQWLAAGSVRGADGSSVPEGMAGEVVTWDVAALRSNAWSARRYRALVGGGADQVWRRLFLLPNQLLEVRADGVSVLQAVPLAPGRCRVRRLDYSVTVPLERARAAVHLARRLGADMRHRAFAVAESVQRGMTDFGYPAAAGLASPAVRWFRTRLAGAVPALARRPAASDN